jgi:hypothetical protein
VGSRESSGFFRGSELPVMLFLLAIAIVGWVLVWKYLVSRTDEQPEPEQVLAGKPPPIETDESVEFETVSDKTPLQFRDMAAYEKLLMQARETTPAGLSAKARRDVFYAHLWDHSSEFRGVPVHLLGTVRRVLYYKSKLGRTGWLYEAWLITPESQKNPYVCVFEDAPCGFPVGADVSERVMFNGYFLKLMKYEAGDVPRAAPLLVGRIEWIRRPPETGSSNRPYYWLAGGVAVMFAISLVRWSWQLRKSMTRRARPRVRTLVDRPTEDISPKELSEFLGSISEDEERPAGQHREG